MKILNYEANAGFGIIFPAKTFIKEFEKDIYIISPGPLDAQTINDLKESPKTLHFIAPNNFHNMYLSDMKKQFLDAKFYGPTRSMKQSGVTLEKTEKLESSEIKCIFIDGHNLVSETCFYFPKSKELVTTDLFFNMHHKMNFMTAFAMRCAGAYKKFSMSRLEKFTVKNKEAFTQSIRSLGELDLVNVYLNHGDSPSVEEFKQYISDFTF